MRSFGMVADPVVMPATDHDHVLEDELTIGPHRSWDDLMRIKAATAPDPRHGELSAAPTTISIERRVDDARPLRKLLECTLRSCGDPTSTSDHSGSRSITCGIGRQRPSRPRSYIGYRNRRARSRTRCTGFGCSRPAESMYSCSAHSDSQQPGSAS